MPNPWYELVDPGEPLSQGDIIEECPILQWPEEGLEADRDAAEDDLLREAISVKQADVIVMTQACDLAYDKVKDVILCPAYPLSKYREAWAENQRAKNQNPTDDNWTSECEWINRGYRWNRAIINSGVAGPEDTETPHRVVDFQKIQRIPRGFLEQLIQFRGDPRFRLMPPYREHLSQSFARYFMRVGLPEDVSRVWKQEGN